MKKFCMCCFAALCMVLAGCTGNHQRVQKPEPSEQENVQQEVPGREAEDSPRSEDQANPIEPNIAPEDAVSSDQFTGTWRDSGTSQYYMEIIREGEDSYIIEINWNRSSRESTVWQLTGAYDETWEGIAYIGAKYEDITAENGTVERKPVLEREEITGLIYFEDNGTLYWIDDFDHTGDNLSFEKE